MKTSIETLCSKGYVVVEYPAAVRAKVEKSIGSWRRFCVLDTATKEQFLYSNNSAGVGYEFKTGKGNKGDRKENFDVALLGKEWLNRMNVVGDSSATQFIRDADELVKAIKPLVLDFAHDIQTVYGIDGFYDEVAQGENTFFIRFIHYFGDRSVGDETANAHVDQSAFTLHLFESAEGLQCLPYNSDWEYMPVSQGETVIIPSMQLQLRSQGELRALCHRVVANPQTAALGRYSAVCFVQLQHTPKYNKDEFGRLQEKTPGFNYKMSFEEFRTMFK